MPQKFEVIAEALPWKAQDLIDALSEGIDITTQRMDTEFKTTTRTFKRVKVAWKIKKAAPIGTVIEGASGTDNTIYKFITRGTKAHVITPKSPRGLLRFQPKFQPKTIPNVLGSTRRSPSGPFVFARRVFNPGVKAREFEENVADRNRLKVRDDVQGAINKRLK